MFGDDVLSPDSLYAMHSAGIVSHSNAGLDGHEDDLPLIRQLCSAVIVAPRVLLSAAHCFFGKDKNREKKTARFGLDILHHPSQEIEILKVFVKKPKPSLRQALASSVFRHLPKRNKQNDLAIVVLKREINPQNNSPVQMDLDLHLKNFQFLTVAGYGAADIADYSVNGWLRRATIDVEYGRDDNHSKIRTTKTEKAFSPSACKGDSGSGAFSKKAHSSELSLVGITVSTHVDCTYSRASFEHLYFHKVWIQTALKKAREYIESLKQTSE